MTAKEFEKWIDKARPGYRIVYHRGYLPVDKGHDVRIREKARIALNASESVEIVKGDGRLALFQRKLHFQCYEYVAVRL